MSSRYLELPGQFHILAHLKSSSCLPGISDSNPARARFPSPAAYHILLAGTTGAVTPRRCGAILASRFFFSPLKQLQTKQKNFFQRHLERVLMPLAVIFFSCRALCSTPLTMAMSNTSLRFFWVSAEHSR